MAADSPVRDLLNEIGNRKVCRASHLAGPFAAEQHALKKHRAEWQSYQGYINAEERRLDREERQQQTAAMLALAGKASEGAEERRGPGRPRKEG